MKKLLGLAALAAAAMLVGCGSPAPSGGDTGGAAQTGGGAKKLVIAWAQWDPAVQLGKLVAQYKEKTGIEVEIQQIPWSQFEDKIKTTWAAKSADYDMIIGDSQWLGTAAEAGHYVDLSDWAKTAVKLDDIEPAALKAYGDYEGKLWALPCMSDALGFAYRKDLFDDPKNKADFKAKYGKDLAVPTTWDEFKNVAEFFTKADGSMHGCILFYSKSYDGAAMGFQPFLWSYGGDWDTLTGPEAKQAMDMWVGLKKFTPTGSENAYFEESLSAFQGGKVAMAMNWFAFFPGLTDKTKNKFADQTGYFAMPSGPKGKFVSLGGQGISISAYSKNQEEAKKFIAWLSEEQTQIEWAKLGGLTANKKAAASEDFKKASPYNDVFTASAPHLKDFNNGPKYSQMLAAAQAELNGAVAGTAKPEEALANLAKQFAELK